MTQTPHVEMAVAINLNDQQPPGAVKIRNVWAYTLLTAKLDSELPSPKRLPQSPFRLCWIVSLFTPFIQRGLAVENTNWLLVHDSIPPTMTPVSITTTHPLPASPFKRGGACLALSLPCGIQSQGARQEQKTKKPAPWGAGLWRVRGERPVAAAYLLPVPELRVEEVGLRRAVVARARGSLPCISL